MNKFFSVFQILLVSLLIACSDDNAVDISKNEVTVPVETESEKEIRLKNQYIKKINSYIYFSNKNISRINSWMDSYINKFGTEETVPKKEQKWISVVEVYDGDLREVKRNIGSEPKMPELDESISEIISIIPILSPLTQNVEEYYINKDYFNDDYKLMNELHNKILPYIPRLIAAINKFDVAMSIEQKKMNEEELKQFEENGELISYNRLLIVLDIADFFKEIEKQQLDTYNIVQKADKEVFQDIYKRLNKHHKDLRDALKIEGQKNKEGYVERGTVNETDFHLRNFINETRNFKDRLYDLLIRMDEKRPFRKNSFGGATLSRGTIEDFNSLHEEIIRYYNGSNQNM